MFRGLLGGGNQVRLSGRTNRVELGIVGGLPNVRHQILGRGNQGMLLGMMGDR